jgi:hypothetical protein
MRARLPRRIEQRLRMSEHVHQKPSNGKIFVKHAFRAWSGMKSESMEDSGLSARLSTSVHLTMSMTMTSVYSRYHRVYEVTEYSTMIIQRSLRSDI